MTDYEWFDYALWYGTPMPPKPPELESWYPAEWIRRKELLAVPGFRYSVRMEREAEELWWVGYRKIRAEMMKVLRPLLGREIVREALVKFAELYKE